MNDDFHIEQHLESVKNEPQTQDNTASDQSEPNQFFEIWSLDEDDTFNDKNQANDQYKNR